MHRRRSISVLALLPLGALAAGEKTAVVPFDPGEIAEFDQQPERIKNLIRVASELTHRELGYTYGSNDPGQGGMDCSGTVHHTLTKAGIKAPRSSHSQYLWMKEAKTLHEVSGHPDTLADAAFRDLHPGDLVFWEGTYETGDRTPPISHVMIFLGTLARDERPVLFGASSGRRFRGQRIHGVSAFDFDLPAAGAKSRIVGYGAVPGSR